LSSSAENLATQCIDGIVATNTGPEMVERGLMLGTALAPAIGYDAAAVIAKEASRTGRTIREVAKEKTDLTDEALIELLNPEKMTEPSLEVRGGGG
jgi:fumarate hydratase class II